MDKTLVSTLTTIVIYTSQLLTTKLMYETCVSSVSWLKKLQTNR